MSVISKPLRIGFLSDARAEHTRRWCKYFAARGHHVDVVTLNPDVLSGYTGIEVFVVTKKWGSSSLAARTLSLPGVLRRLNHIAESRQWDLVHAHSVGGYAWLGMWGTCRPYVVTPWGTDLTINAAKPGLTRFLTTRAVRHADLVICDAEHVRTELSKMGTDRQRIEIVMFGTDVTRFKPLSAAERLSFRKNQAIPSDALMVISSRTLCPVHDVTTFARAIPLILARHEKAYCVIAGDGPERTKIERIAAELGVSQRTRFIGYYDEEAISGWFGASDAYVSTSLTDAGLASSTAEAMACGLPVVITENGDNADWVRNGRNGYLVPNGDFNALAESLSTLLDDRSIRVRFGIENRKTILARYNYHVEMERVERMYRALTTREAGRS